MDEEIEKEVEEFALKEPDLLNREKLKRYHHLLKTSSKYDLKME